MSISRPVVGIDRERLFLQNAAMRIIQRVLETPLAGQSRGQRREIRKDWLAPPPLSAYRRLEPLGFGLPNQGEDEYWLFNPKDCTPDVVWPINVGVIIEGAGENLDKLFFSQQYTVTPKQVRGYATRFGPYMVRTDHAQQDKNGALVCFAGLQVWLGGKWCDAQNRILWEGRDADHAIPDRGGVETERDREQPALNTAIALRQRYEWAVALGLEQSPSIRFATDPTGISEIFKIRDLPEGRDRREALLRWITDHWRQDRKDPEIERYVRKSMRGATAFTWHGMEAEILPAQYDLDQLERFKAERLAMKVAGTDKRKRERK